MSDNETLADIVAELRADANAVMDDLHNDDCWTNVEAGEIYASLANRIEAAAERERNAHINDIHNALYAATRLPGNAAAMREALEKVLECYKSGAIRTVYNDPESWRHDDELCYLKDDVEAALAAPARNCDVGTAEERAARYLEHCTRHPRCVGCSCCGRVQYGLCEFAWAQMPYEKKEESNG